MARVRAGGVPVGPRCFSDAEVSLVAELVALWVPVGPGGCDVVMPRLEALHAGAGGRRGVKYWPLFWDGGPPGWAVEEECERAGISSFVTRSGSPL